jgi:hypothetical protein
MANESRLRILTYLHTSKNLKVAVIGKLAYVGYIYQEPLVPIRKVVPKHVFITASQHRKMSREDLNSKGKSYIKCL